MRDLSTHRLVYVAPRTGIGGVGDYADDAVAALRPHFAEVCEHRHGGPGAESVRDLLEHRRAVRRLVDTAPGGRVVVHTELSGGGLAGFWSLPPDRRALVTATVHDPPGLVWWPARTRFLARHRVLNHGLHYPLKAPTRRVLEPRVARRRDLFALTRSGAAALRAAYPEAVVHTSAHPVPSRPVLPDAADRPAAVGLFGHVYPGKGFDAVHEMRARLSPDITLRLAGRGTERLPALPGVEVVGPVDGAAEDAFFASVRAIALPYGPRTPYGPVFPASGVAARAAAYATPVVSNGYGPLVELVDDGGAVVAAGGPSDLATAVEGLVRDRGRLSELGAQCRDLAVARRADRVVTDFLDVWRAR